MYNTEKLMGAAESKVSDKLLCHTHRLWRPTSEWWYCVAIVLSRQMPRNKAFVSDMLLILHDMVFEVYDFTKKKMVCERDSSFHRALYEERIIFFNEYNFPEDMNAPDISIRHITKMFPCSRVTDLELSNTSITEEGISCIAKSLSSSHLRCLELQKCGVTDSGLALLTSSLHKSKLIHLDLNENSITDVGALCLANCLSLCRLGSLRLRGNWITDLGMIKLAEALPRSNMKILSLSWNKITDKGVKNLMRWLTGNRKKTGKKHTWLKPVKRSKDFDWGISCCPIPVLHSLYLRWNNITDASVVQIAYRLPLTNLIDLNLDHTYTGDSGVKALALAFECKGSKLIYLSLVGNYITNVGAKALKKSFPYSTLELLDIRNNKINHPTLFVASHCVNFNRNGKGIRVNYREDDD